MKNNDTSARLKMILSRLENEVGFAYDLDEAKEELHLIILELKHTIDFVLPKDVT